MIYTHTDRIFVLADGLCYCGLPTGRRGHVLVHVKVVENLCQTRHGRYFDVYRTITLQGSFPGGWTCCLLNKESRHQVAVVRMFDSLASVARPPISRQLPAYPGEFLHQFTLNSYHLLVHILQIRMVMPLFCATQVLYILKRRPQSLAG